MNGPAKRGAAALIFLALMALISCGGDSASSESAVSSPETSAVVPSTDSGVAPSTDVGSAPATPVELLVESSYDIDAIDGPVVLWFWAPG